MNEINTEGKEREKDGSYRKPPKINPKAGAFVLEDVTRFVYVKSNYKNFFDGGEHQAFYEKSPAHEGGEVSVFGDIVRVRLTYEVALALERGDIVEVSEAAFEKQEKEKLRKISRTIEGRKEFYRYKFEQATGITDKAVFDAAWSAIHAKETLSAIITADLP